MRLGITAKTPPRQVSLGDAMAMSQNRRSGTGVRLVGYLGWVAWSLASMVFGVAFALLTVYFVNHSNIGRRLFVANAATKAGGLILGAGLLLLAVVPITMGLFGEGPGDVGWLWCGTYLTRWADDCPGCCQSNGAYGNRLDLSVWPMLAGAVVIMVGHLQQRWTQG